MAQVPHGKWPGRVWLGVLSIVVLAALSLGSLVWRNYQAALALPDLSKAVVAAQGELSQGQFRDGTIDALGSAAGYERTASYVLAWAQVLWRQGNQLGAEALLDRMASRGLQLYLSSAQDYEAALLCTDLVLSQPRLTPGERINRLDVALTFAPDYPDALAVKGLELASLDDQDSAKAMLGRALAIASRGENEGLIRIGRYYLYDENDPVAAGQAWIWMRWAQYAYLAGDLAQAEESARTSLELHAANPWAENLMAQILLQAGRCHEAQRHARAALTAADNVALFRITLDRVTKCLGTSIP
jgi:hypothetical protein